MSDRAIPYYRQDNTRGFSDEELRRANWLLTRALADLGTTYDQASNEEIDQASTGILGAIHHGRARS